MPPLQYNQHDEQLDEANNCFIHKIATHSNEHPQDRVRSTSSIATPDHWPTCSGRSMFEVLNTANFQQQSQEATNMNTAAPHVFFYSINRLLPQQDEECWENDTAVSDFSFSDEDSEYK